MKSHRSQTAAAMMTVTTRRSKQLPRLLEKEDSSDFYKSFNSFSCVSFVIPQEHAGIEASPTSFNIASILDKAKAIAASLDGIKAGRILPEPVTVPVESVSCDGVEVALHCFEGECEEG